MSTPVEQAAVERVAEAMWAATSNTDLAWREIPVVVMNGYRDMARAAIEALQLPVEWGVGVPFVGGSWDVNANRCYSETEARKLLKSLNGILPDDRRRVVQRFGAGPWRTAGEAR